MNKKHLQYYATNSAKHKAKSPTDGRIYGNAQCHFKRRAIYRRGVYNESIAAGLLAGDDQWKRGHLLEHPDDASRATLPTGAEY